MTKGQLLVQFDNSESFMRLRAEKKSLREELVKNQSQIPPTDSAAFSGFVRAVNPGGLLPPFPKLGLHSLQILNSHKLLDQYDAIAAGEAAMLQYFVFSPVDGRIGSVNSFGELQKGSVIATVIPEGFTVSPPVPGKPGTTISLEDSNGKVVKAVIRKQSAKATQLRGKLKPGSYGIAD